MKKIKESLFLDVIFFFMQVTFVLAIIFAAYLFFEQIYSIFFK